MNINCCSNSFSNIFSTVCGNISYLLLHFNTCMNWFLHVHTKTGLFPQHFRNLTNNFHDHGSRDREFSHVWCFRRWVHCLICYLQYLFRKHWLYDLSINLKLVQYGYLQLDVLGIIFLFKFYCLGFQTN